MENQAWVAFSGMIAAVVGQWLNRRPELPVPVVKIGLALVGLALYLPIQQPWTVGFMPWFNEAWVFALAVPGAASLVGMLPGMGTNTQK